jgi:hypothetical protein
MKGVQGNQAAQVRMFAHDAIPAVIGAINPDNGVTIDSGGYSYTVGDEITLNTPSSGAAAKLKVTSIGKQDIINVQAVTGQQFYLNGRQLASGNLVLLKGKTYTFYQKSALNTGHEFLFSESANGVTPYTTGITNTGAVGSSRAITFTVASNAPATLHYYCGAHPTTMGGTIEIKDSGDDFFDTYPNNAAVKSLEVLRQAGAKPFGKGYQVDDVIRIASETTPPTKFDESAFIGKVASIDLANTSDRGACIYIGIKMASIVAKMESGLEATFKNISAGSFMPILVKEITAATPDSGTLADNDIIALY